MRCGIILDTQLEHAPKLRDGTQDTRTLRTFESRETESASPSMLVCELKALAPPYRRQRYCPFSCRSIFLVRFLSGATLSADSEIARRRHSVSATGSPGPAKTTTTAAGAVERGVPARRADALADRANTQRGTAGPESWFEEASSSEDDDEGGDRFAVDTRPTPATPNSSPVVSAATASSRRPVS